MLCTECTFNNFHADSWGVMRQHYKDWHPEVKNCGKYFTKEAKAK